MVRSRILVTGSLLVFVGGLLLAGGPPLEPGGSTWEFVAAKAKTAFKLKGAGKAKEKELIQAQLHFDEGPTWSATSDGESYGSGPRQSLKPSGRAHLCTLDAPSSAALAAALEDAFEQVVASEGFDSTADLAVDDFLIRLKIKPIVKQELARAKVKQKMLLTGTVQVDGLGTFNARLTQKVKGVSADIPLSEVL